MQSFCTFAGRQSYPMIPTLTYIERKFEEFNKLCFDGKLKKIPFRLSNARTFLGKIEFKRKRTLWGGWKYVDFVFCISKKMDLAESEVEDTILHEMIHYWILSNQLHDTSPHGKLFREKMMEINRKYNRNISVRHRVSEEEHDRDREVRRHLICISRFRDGRCGITVAARTRLYQLWEEMPNFPNLEVLKWVCSTDPFFNRFPRSQTPRVYIVSAETLERHLVDARELVRVGEHIGYKGSVKN